MANNVNVITRIRTEHLTEEEKRRYKGIFPIGKLEINRTLWLSDTSSVCLKNWADKPGNALLADFALLYFDVFCV